MSSCFLCDCSHKFIERDKHSFFYRRNHSDYSGTVYKYMKYMPIMVGSSGTDLDDQQHKNNKKQNYVSYRVKKLEFCCVYNGKPDAGDADLTFPDYVLIFKVPFRNPVFEYNFTLMQNFMLFSEPECVLDYKVLQSDSFGGIHGAEDASKQPNKFNININKPFIVCPNDYVGVLYMFTPTVYSDVYVDASARVWFDIA